jgi:hypothetical protein
LCDITERQIFNPKPFPLPLSLDRAEGDMPTVNYKETSCKHFQESPGNMFFIVFIKIVFTYSTDSSRRLTKTLPPTPFPVCTSKLPPPYY